ncbi:MAG: hypothetical protein JWN83_1253 [Chitinophagaceae bacterium]|nr:hypothetical protein [Chitinophagaceae bacterium]
MKKNFQTFALIMIALFSAGFATAQTSGTHFLDVPTVTANSNGSVTVSGSIVGLGNIRTVTIDVDVVISFHIDCYNRRSHQVYGQSDDVYNAHATGSAQVDKNGRANFAVTAWSSSTACQPAPPAGFYSILSNVSSNGGTVSGAGISWSW